MKTRKDNERRFAHWGTLIVFCVAIVMVSVAIMPSVMAGKPVKPPVTSDFNLTTLDSRGNVGSYPRIVVGGAPDYAVHITYYDSTNHALKYAKYTVDWTVSTLATVGNRLHYPTGGVADLALDVAGNVHIVYVDVNNKLQYINNVGGEWSVDGLAQQPAFRRLGRRQIRGAGRQRGHDAQQGCGNGKNKTRSNK